MGLVSEIRFALNEESLREAGRQAEASGATLGRTVADRILAGLKSGGNAYVKAGEDAGVAFSRAMKDGLRLAQAGIKEAQTRGLLTPEEARRKGEEVARAHNAGVLAGMSRLADTGNLSEKGFLQTANALQKVGDVGERATNRIHAGFTQVRSVVGGLDRLLATVGVSLSLGAITHFLVETNREFERTIAQLQATEGDADRARAAFERLRGVRTGRDLSELTEAFINLRGTGINPTARDMGRLADFAAAKSKSIADVAKAAVQAGNGELGQLRQLHVGARAEGDQLVLTYQDMSFRVRKNAGDVVEALTKIAEAKFAGAAEREAQTLGGSFNILQEAAAELARRVGESGLNQDLAAIARRLTEVTNAAAAGDPVIRNAYAGARDSVVTFLAIVNAVDARIKAANETFGNAGTQANVFFRMIGAQFELLARSSSNELRTIYNEVVRLFNFVFHTDAKPVALLDTKEIEREIASIRALGAASTKSESDLQRAAAQAEQRARDLLSGAPARERARQALLPGQQEFAARVKPLQDTITAYGALADAAEKSGKRQSAVEQRAIADVKTAREQIRAILADEQRRLAALTSGGGGIPTAVANAGRADVQEQVRRIEALRKLLANQAPPPSSPTTVTASPKAGDADREEEKRQRAIEQEVRAFQRLDDAAKLTADDRARVAALEEQLTGELAKQVGLHTQAATVRREELEQQLAILRAIEHGTDALVDRSRKARESHEEQSRELQQARETARQLGVDRVPPVVHEKVEQTVEQTVERKVIGDALPPIAPAVTQQIDREVIGDVPNVPPEVSQTVRREVTGDPASIDPDVTQTVDRVVTGDILPPVEPTVVQRVERVVSTREEGAAAPAAPSPTRQPPAIASTTTRVPLDVGERRVNVSSEFADRQREAAENLARLEEARIAQLDRIRASQAEINARLAEQIKLEGDTSAEAEKRRLSDTEIKRLESERVQNARALAEAQADEIRRAHELVRIADDTRKDEIAVLRTRIEQGDHVEQARARLLALEKELVLALSEQNLTIARQRELTGELTTVRTAIKDSKETSIVSILADSLGLAVKDSDDAVNIIQGKFAQLFDFIRSEGGSIGDVFALTGAKIASGLLTGVARYAGLKVAENIARAHEETAQAQASFASTLGPGIPNLLGIAAASAHAHAAAMASAAAVKWGVLAGGAAIAGAAVGSLGSGGGGGAGGGSASLANIGGRQADKLDVGKRVTVYVEAGLFDPHNRRQVDSLGRLFRELGYTDFDLRPFGGKG